MIGFFVRVVGFAFGVSRESLRRAEAVRAAEEAVLVAAEAEVDCPDPAPCGRCTGPVPLHYSVLICDNCRSVPKSPARHASATSGAVEGIPVGGETPPTSPPTGIPPNK